MTIDQILSYVGGITAPLVLIGGLYITLRKDKNAESAQAAQAAVEGRRDDYTAIQNDLTSARAETQAVRDEAARLRGELESAGAKYRDEIADIWTQFSQFRREAEAELGHMRSEVTRMRKEKADDEEHIAMLTKWINERKEPPAPTRPPLTS